MSRRTSVKRSLAVPRSLLNAILLAGALLAGCAREDVAVDDGLDSVTVRFESRFLERMIGHHQMAVDMSETCVQKATHEELGDLCQKIVADQEEEIATMRSWLAEWYGVQAYEPEMTTEGEQEMEELASLDGAEFEAEFLEKMTRHHEQAVSEGSTCVLLAEHEELGGLCEQMVEAQTGEIDLMQTWQRQWFGVSAAP